MQVPYTVVAYILLGHIHSLPKCTTHSTPLVFETQETLELALPLTFHRCPKDVGESRRSLIFNNFSLEACCVAHSVKFHSF